MCGFLGFGVVRLGARGKFWGGILLVLPPGGLSKGRMGPLVVPPTIEGLFYFFNALNYAAISFLIALLWDVG